MSRLPDFALWPVTAIAGAVAVLLIALSGRYGYHGDELYFIASGRHLAWGYPDQPVLVPLLARLMTDISATSLVVLRLPSAFAAAVTVAVTGLTARELGFGRPTQILATAAMSINDLVLATGHLLSTSTFDLMFWTLAIWVGLRALRTGDARWWLVAGAVIGLGLFSSDLIFFLAVAVIAGMILAGPREPLRSPWLYAGIAVALVMWTPYLLWQAHHGWPEFAISRSVANGNSTSSAPRSQFIPLQFLMAGPWLTPFWVAGLVVLWRRRRSSLSWVRPFLVAYPLLVIIFIATGGKPYYIGGMFPLLFAAGSDAIWSWTRHGASRRRVVGVALLGVLSLPDLLITLPIVPVASYHKTPINALNPDAGETIGWPTFIHEIAAVYTDVPAATRPSTVILTSDYGEAGGTQRYGPAYGVPSTAVYSVQNAYWLWGPPPPTATTTVAVGFDKSQLTPLFRDVHLAATLNNHLSVNNDEQDEPVYLCTGLRRPWTSVWRGLRYYG